MPIPITIKKAFNKTFFLYLLLSLTLCACRKNNGTPLANNSDSTLKLMQRVHQEFNRRVYSNTVLELEQPLKLNIKLIWTINWSSRDIKPDSTNGVIYVYIPCSAHLERNGISSPITNINYQRFLLASIKNKKIEFSSAYANADSNNNSIKFTGLLTVKSLDRKVGGLYTYDNGKTQSNSLNILKAKANKKQSVNGLTVNEYCEDLYDCTWAWDCVDWFEGSYSGGIDHEAQLGGCSIPPTGMPAGNPLTICPSTNGWILTNTRYVSSFCDPSTPPPPPPPPTAPPGVGGGTPVGASGGTGDIHQIMSSNSSLTETEVQQLQIILNKITADCIGQATFNYFNSTNVKFTFISSASSPYPAYYAPSADIIALQNVSTTLSFTLEEEFFHAYQNKVMPGGTQKYAGKAGSANIEFEAKFLRDLNYHLNPPDVPQGVGLAVPGQAYQDFLNEVTNGYTSFPTSLTSA